MTQRIERPLALDKPCRADLSVAEVDHTGRLFLLCTTSRLPAPAGEDSS